MNELDEEYMIWNGKRYTGWRMHLIVVLSLAALAAPFFAAGFVAGAVFG